MNSKTAKLIRRYSKTFLAPYTQGKQLWLHLNRLQRRRFRLEMQSEILHHLNETFLRTNPTTQIPGPINPNQGQTAHQPNDH